VGLTIRFVFVAVLAAFLATPALAANGAIPTQDWAGFTLTGPNPASPISFTHATGTWKVPAVACGESSSASASTIMVGLGGFTTPLLEVIGTSTECGATGPASNYGWYQVDWGQEMSFAMRIEPGDTMTASVSVSTKNLVTMTLQNVTRHTSAIVRRLAGAVDLSSADWVTGSLGCSDGSCGFEPLADFGSLEMSKVQATAAGGQTGTLATSGWSANPLQISTSAGTSAGTCGPAHVATDGASFDVPWTATATSGC
jgi:hypothetical protein